MARGKKTGGRVKGTPNKVTMPLRARIAEEADPIAFLTDVMQGKPIKAALAKGDTEALTMFPTVEARISAARILADKIVPNAKSRPITLDLPEINAAQDLVAGIAAALKAMAAGEITPEEAATVAGVLELKRRAIETAEHERRLIEIERRLEQRS